jgi:uncharacterized membrane protein
MASDVQGTVREILINAIENAGKSANGGSEDSPAKPTNGSSKGLSGGKALAAAGLGAAALAPVAMKGVGKLAQELGVDTLDVIRSPEKALEGLTGSLGDRVGAGIGEKVSAKVDESGGPAGILSDTVKGALPFGGGGGGGKKGGATGVGKGRRMPVQQHVDIGAPVETVYNQWTQFELWPDFMHRVKRVTQEDDCTVSFMAKIWGRSREFTAKIETQHPDQRIKWKVSQGMTLTGVVTFHELGPRLTRVLLSFDVEPGGFIEKGGRGMRHIKRAARGDFHRFKAFIEMQEFETGAWRGVIEEGELVEEHDPEYDKDRPYSDPKDTLGEQDEDSDDEDKQADEDEDEATQKRSSGTGRASSSRSRRASNGRSTSGAGRTRAASASSSSRSASGSSGRTRKAASKTSSGGRSRSGSSASKRSGSSKTKSTSARGRGSAASSSGRSSTSKTRGRQTKSRSKS